MSQGRMIQWCHRQSQVIYRCLNDRMVQRCHGQPQDIHGCLKKRLSTFPGLGQQMNDPGVRGSGGLTMALLELLMQFKNEQLT